MRIAVTGKMRSGKDTFANYFIEREFYNLAFADGITDVIAQYFPEAWQEGKPREHYQVIGQAFRQLNPTIWVEHLDDLLGQWFMLDGVNVPVIVTDLRQPNEYEYLKANGFTVVKVETSEELRIERIKKSGDAHKLEYLHHETEKHIDDMDYDYLVTNDTSLVDLLEQAEFLYAELVGEQHD
ncbi:AAA family ATPase [Geomicrobium sp. JCM 19055]|uniref:AAA family ATPase n=1 Tax=Geomicrobium sp. JCM 19055 TaxID=1460649 RepID=UPI00045EDB31|nr:AAA family ATPase [Geomicrobium sp. JCM 19055]GAK00870.1 adenylate kinase [Geomicrobium sp. JCM 19055]